MDHSYEADFIVEQLSSRSRLATLNNLIGKDVASVGPLNAS